MKNMIGFAIVICLMMIMIPMIAVGGFPDHVPGFTENPTRQNITTSQVPSLSGEEQPETEAVLKLTDIKSDEGFKLYDQASDNVIEVTEAEFLYGAVVCEMPLSFADEALKAQAVACHSYYAQKRNAQRARPSEEMKGADFEVNTEKWSIYTTKEQMEKKWGDQFDANYKRVKALVDSVSTVIMEYEGEPIVAAFHAQSGGMTENAFNVWGTEYPYLTAVDSPGDALSPGYQTETTYSAENFKAVLEKRINGIKLDKDPKKWVGDLVKTPSGTVIMCSVGDRKASGAEMRAFFSLRSAVFDLEYKDDSFIFTVYGHGHGVGMSQYGAQEMAKQGSDYEEILSWYYRVDEQGDL